MARYVAYAFPSLGIFRLLCFGLRAMRPGELQDANLCYCLQTKTVEVSLEALQSGGHESLPPLMNPTMLEASDDLTNLSHLNEPAGKYTYTFALTRPAIGRILRT